MTTDLNWSEIALRLGLAFVAGTLIGINRGEHARPAGLRTTLLVCLAASIAMIQTNLLLKTVGKAADSFVVLDLMRLPLGILSGMGFIGAGVILRKGDLIVGVTTAATLWFVTVMGLCFGGGQIWLGLVALALALLILEGLKSLGKYWKQDRRATLTLRVGVGGPDEFEISRFLKTFHFVILSCSVSYERERQERGYVCEVGWRGHNQEPLPPSFIKALSERLGVHQIEWKTS
jgi:putative Mg2+ transporter-C (MgtC) family protein